MPDATHRDATTPRSTAAPDAPDRHTAPAQDTPTQDTPAPDAPTQDTPEHRRLAESPGDSDPWRLWGPYLAGRQWGTVREDYSEDGDAWDFFPFDHAHRRAYRWGEDGIAGLCDRFGFLNLGVALWNGHDDRLKERYFGLTNGQGNHGEDVKEHWWHVDATPTHSWAKTLYRYPQAAYPYEDLVRTNGSLSRESPEYELSDTGVLREDRFFDIETVHAKASPDDVCVTITATNHGPDPAPLDLVAQLWFRNTWAWGRDERVPQLRRLRPPELRPGGVVAIEATHGFLGRYVLAADTFRAEGAPLGAARAAWPHHVAPEVMFCDNESNDVELFGAPENRSPHPTDAIDAAIVRDDRSLLNPAETGTKAAVRWRIPAIAPGASVTVRLRLTGEMLPLDPFGVGFDDVLADREREADEFYAAVLGTGSGPTPSPAGAGTGAEQTTAEDAFVARRAFAGLLWGKQHYRYSVREWLEGDPAFPAPPGDRLGLAGRNSGWRHLALADVISMPDEWEYPWFASWDLAFHCVALAHIDPEFAKGQLVLLCREWAMHPDGQLPAYEWAFGDVNPPVHAWAAWQVYCIDGGRDLDFLTRVFAKLLLNFSWWVNRKDADGSNLFEGGFLGMDNIGLFDRSKGLPPGHRLEQSDATSWMAFYCLTMMRIALELARQDRVWDDLATKFLEHFLSIADAMDTFGSAGVELWDEADGFFYDVLVADDGSQQRLPIRSMVGLLPLLAVAVAPEWAQAELPDFAQNLHWLQRHRPEQMGALLRATSSGANPDADVASRLTLAVLHGERLTRVLARMLDEREFLSPYGLRSLSAAYREPFTVSVAGQPMTIAYLPGESDSGLFGGNSNWRGPVWFPVNVLMADALAVFAEGSGADVTVEFPTGSGTRVSLGVVARELEGRLVRLFRPDETGRRPSTPRHHPAGPLWDAHPTFSEYFHGDTGAGIGASHQTGWTALVAHLVCRHAQEPADPKTP
ncbi:MGH1-like glycoside hydrolase domain-containing protein [Sinomonas albida]|uniref:MGH1-like glycoside hydrolase domain-containing protein n=1 Tax=Sinomonas albida TaxID=369942 RepID=UPI001F43F12D|nr:glucosidase [Sinomonas albida]